jgi:hypothetical protein
MRIPAFFITFMIIFISIATIQATKEVVGISPRSPKTAIRGLLMERATAGQDCTGSEGMWNCMTNSFQRCASGRWSEVMQCAAGTQCSPAGMGYQFNVVSSSSKTASSSDANSELKNPNERWLFSVLLLAVPLLALIQ